MIPLLQLDITWQQWAVGVGACLRRSPHDADLHQQIGSAWGCSDAVVCLSVRTAFDALLAVLALPKGCEVLISALTIGPMLDIIEAHGLVAVPVDLHQDTFFPTVPSLQGALSKRSRVLLVAQLFGARCALTQIAAIARQHGLLLIEDCAQAFAGRDYHGDAEADVSLFSFGPLKTCTALGGALARFVDPGLRQRVVEHMARHPRLSRSSFAKRLLRFGFIKLCEHATWTTDVVAYFLKCQGRDPQTVLSNLLKAFAGADLLPEIRQRPNAPLLLLLRHRLQHHRRASLDKRTGLGLQLMEELHSAVTLPGSQAAFRSFWLFPILCANAQQTCDVLWKAGYWACHGPGNLRWVSPVAPDKHATPTVARFLVDSIVCVPVHHRLSAARRKRMTDIVSHVSRPT